MPALGDPEPINLLNPNAVFRSRGELSLLIPPDIVESMLLIGDLVISLPSLSRSQINGTKASDVYSDCCWFRGCEGSTILSKNIDFCTVARDPLIVAED